ncbi:uncharacterized protein BDZ99DRAFT_474248 [Mytilinidion resinicola]|uniref:Uncharacterized protein n=1 Tax=Mytilinidion resinicola TaxID=574789 RepID=A0A6A6YYJ2_9PEZI|nr:uncharacterized protein BDZ99DRAFT_474248 [Mytilinidion resinicola]KAF2813618.1 hypothetical protein BDZ99DRAFT_474248 [Mytilinidion resinicola]
MAEISAVFSRLALAGEDDLERHYIPNGWQNWENATHLTADDLFKLGFYLGGQHILEKVITPQPDSSDDASLSTAFASMSIAKRAYPTIRPLNPTESNLELAMIEYFKALHKPKDQEDTEDDREMYREYEEFLSQDPHGALIETYHLRGVLKRYVSEHIDVQTVDSDGVWGLVRMALCQIDVTACLYRCRTEYELNERAMAYDSGNIDGQLDALLKVLSDDPDGIRFGIAHISKRSRILWNSIMREFGLCGSDQNYAAMLARLCRIACSPQNFKYSPVLQNGTTLIQCSPTSFGNTMKLPKCRSNFKISMSMSLCRGASLQSISLLLRANVGDTQDISATISDVVLVIYTSHSLQTTVSLHRRANLFFSLQPPHSPYTVNMESEDDSPGEAGDMRGNQAGKNTEGNKHGGATDDNIQDGGVSDLKLMEAAYIQSLFVPVDNPIFILQLPPNLRQRVSNRDFLEDQVQRHLALEPLPSASQHTSTGIIAMGETNSEMIEDAVIKHIESLSHANETLHDFRMRLRREPTDDDEMLSVSIDAIAYALIKETVSQEIVERLLLLFVSYPTSLPRVDVMAFKYLCSITTVEDLVVAVFKVLESMLVRYPEDQEGIFIMLLAGVRVVGAKYHVEACLRQCWWERDDDYEW